MILHVEESAPFIRGALAHYVEMYLQFLEPRPSLFVSGTIGRVQRLEVGAPLGNLYGVSTFSDLGNMVAPMPTVEIESSWLPHCVLSEAIPVLQGVQTSSTVGDIVGVFGLSEFRGFIKGEQKQKLVVRAPRSGIFGVVETAAPSWGVFSEATPIFYADLWREGEGQHCEVKGKLPRMTGLVLPENKAVFKVSDTRVRFAGEVSTYEVFSFWGTALNSNVQASASIYQVVDSGALFLNSAPSFSGTFELSPRRAVSVEVALLESTYVAVTGRVQTGRYISPCYIEDTPPLFAGEHLAGHSSVAVLVSANSVVGGVQSRGAVSNMSVVGLSTCSGIINSASSHLGPLAAEPPPPVFKGDLATGVLGRALFFDISSTMEGVGREYIGFR